MSNTQQYEMDDMNYGTNAIQHSVRKQSSKRRPEINSQRRRSKAPTSINGIHRRRNRKMSW